MSSHTHVAVSLDLDTPVAVEPAPGGTTNTFYMRADQLTVVFTGAQLDQLGEEIARVRAGGAR